MSRKVLFTVLASVLLCGADAAPTPPPGSPEAAPTPPLSGPEAAPKPSLSGDSTLADWRAAPSSEHSRVAVALAKNRLGPDATKLDIAKMAMEITGCVSVTAKDSRFEAWKVAPTATTCLTAPERPQK